MRFNQTTSKSDLLTKKYSITEIEELKISAEAANITFSSFRRNFDVQCMRKTHQGYYVVLLLEDGGNAFVFFNNDNELIRIISSNGFMGKDEFQNQVAEQMPQSEVLDFDHNAILAPISSVDATAHIVMEGIFLVKYARFIDGKIIQDPIVTSIQFLPNESIPTNDDAFVRDEIPFIFEHDKRSE